MHFVFAGQKIAIRKTGSETGQVSDLTCNADSGAFKKLENEEA